MHACKDNNLQTYSDIKLQRCIALQAGNDNKLKTYSEIQ